MIQRLATKPLADIRPTPVFSQTPFWGKIKHQQGFEPITVGYSIAQKAIDPHITTQKILSEDLLILIKHLDAQHCFAYIPYGPKIEPTFEHQGMFLEELSENLKLTLPKNCVFIRYDLKWLNPWAEDHDFFDEVGNWLEPPQDQIQEFRVNFSTEHWNLRKSPVDILPKNTFFVDLTLSDDALLSNMRASTRHKIHKTFKKGIRVESYDASYLPNWYELYQETANRHHLSLQKPDFFRELLESQTEIDPNTSVKLLMADYEGQFLAAMFLLLSHQRATYLYGASTIALKHLKPTYALQWTAIKLAKSAGCTEYDLFGAAPNRFKSHPLHGIHHYKKGFGGKLYHRMGCWDYPFEPQRYQLIKAQEKHKSDLV